LRNDSAVDDDTAGQVGDEQDQSGSQTMTTTIEHMMAPLQDRTLGVTRDPHVLGRPILDGPPILQPGIAKTQK
jgi:hypothetical protein